MSGGQAPGSPAPPATVRAMFDRIAPGYDAMNTLMTLGLDRGWRRATLEAAALRGGERVLDVACGTGKLAIGARMLVGSTGAVTGLDASTRMLATARRASERARLPTNRAGDILWVEGDAMALPFADGSFEVTMIGFGLRNLPDYAGGLAEMARVTAAGGRVLVLEIARPESFVPRIVHETWFRRVVPLIGRAVGHRAAYAYLPASLDPYPDPSAIGGMMAAAGLREVRWRRLTGGLTTLHLGEAG